MTTPSENRPSERRRDQLRRVRRDVSDDTWITFENYNTCILRYIALDALKLVPTTARSNVATPQTVLS